MVVNQCRNATVAVANSSGLLCHARSRNCLCYSLLLVSRSLFTLAVVNMYYFHFFEQTVSYVCILVYPCSQALPRINEKSFLYCKRQNAGRGLVHCQHVMLIDIPTLYYCYCIHLLGYGGSLSCSQTPGKPYGRLSMQIKHFPPLWTSKLPTH